MSLETTLHDLLHRARKSPGIPARASLKGGLTIAVLHDGSITHLQLSRPRVDPSLTEFETVLAHLPYTIDAGKIEKRRFTHAGMHYLKAAWSASEHSQVPVPAETAAPGATREKQSAGA